MPVVFYQQPSTGVGQTRFVASQSCVEGRCRQRRRNEAEGITAYLRPNPSHAHSSGRYTGRTAQWGVDPLQGHHGTAKRQLSARTRTQGAGRFARARKKVTRITQSQHEDLQRNMIFDLRAIFVATLRGAHSRSGQADLAYYDKIIDIENCPLQGRRPSADPPGPYRTPASAVRVEIETATMNLRTPKVQRCQLLNDRTPVDQFA